MPKYQIILSSNQQIPDDEFTNLVDTILINTAHHHPQLDFKLIEARNLEGIREELWKTKEEIKMDLCNIGTIKDNNKELNNKTIDESFDEIFKLFKLDS